MTRYQVYVNGFTKNDMFATDLAYDNLQEAYNKANDLLTRKQAWNPYVQTVRTQVRKITTEIIFDSGEVK